MSFWRALGGDQRALAAYAMSTAVVLVAVMCTTLGSSADPAHGPWPTVGEGGGALRPLARWDGAWYLTIARDGYQAVGGGLRSGPRTFAFFPLYPTLVHALSVIGHTSLVGAGIQVSLVCGAVAAVLLRRLTERLAGPAAADRAVLLFCFFPAAFVLSMTYAESLFLALACAALLAMERRRWIVAGVLLALVGLTRPTALLLIAACGTAALVVVVRRRDLRPLAAPAIGVLGPAAYWVYVSRMTGTPRGWLYIEERYWHDRATLGVGCVRHLVELVDRPRWSFGFGHLNLWMAALGLVVALIGAVLLVRARLPTAVTLYGLGALAFAASSANVGVRPRMVLVAFPLIIGIALATRGRAFRWLLALSALGLVAMTVMSMATYAAFP